MKSHILLTLFSVFSASVCAQNSIVPVHNFNYSGPMAVQHPVMLDSTDVNAKKYLNHAVLDREIDLSVVKKGSLKADSVIQGSDKQSELHLLGFTLSNQIYTTATISVKGIKEYNLYVDGKPVADGKATLQPALHDVVVKCLTAPGEKDTVRISVDGKKFTIGTYGKDTHPVFTLTNVLQQQQFTAAKISPDGKWMISSTYQLTPNREVRQNYLWNLNTKTCQQVNSTRWMPRTNKFYYTRKNETMDGYTLIAVDPETLQETILTEYLPESSFEFSPTEDYVIYSVTQEGPKENPDVYEIINPDDRQPGWRNRSNIYKFDLKTGLSQQLTYGHHNTWLCDISRDGKKLLIAKAENDVAKMRPTDFNSLYILDVETMALDTVVVKDGFASDGSFSPDGKQIIVQGSPESFSGIGKNVKEGQTPSMFDYQLYLLSPEGGKNTETALWHVTPLTRDFNPSVSSFQWSAADGQVYFNAEDKDCVHLFRLNPKTKAIQQISTPEETIGRWSVSNCATALAWYGKSAMNGDRLYVLNTKNLKNILVDDLHAKQYSDFDLGSCTPYTWVNPEGDSICCRFYLPPHFDPSKKYPMIVNYYGGCSPTSRTFGGRYSAHAYAALGYVVLIINPRGASGFGQKWSAAHVNTAGQGVADDIIGSVKAFCKDHSYVNEKKIGCIGASYGGFMTQYLQTVTDIFAAAVSHAGISDHTSYWGYGYWGYSYSQTSMANSYPWTRKDLYVDQSPLFRADKVHTPLLFVHGAADTNVPINESIQMYTALKLLGRPTAFVAVEGQNHWILDYQKSIKWQNTIWAWFAKWLQDDDSWWESMYSSKEL